MSYIRFGWGLNHIKGASDSYIICTSDGKGKEYIQSYGFGSLGMAELLCDAIDGYWKDDPVFAQWFKERVAEKLGVELRSNQISFNQSEKILMGELDAVSLKKITKRQKKAKEKREKRSGNKLDRLIENVLGKEHVRKMREKIREELK